MNNPREELIKYRLDRAHETLEEARIMADTKGFIVTKTYRREIIA